MPTSTYEVASETLDFVFQYFRLRLHVEQGRLCIEFLTGFTGIFERWTFDGLIRQRNVLSPATRALPTTGSGHQPKGAAEGRGAFKANVEGLRPGSGFRRLLDEGEVAAKDAGLRHSTGAQTHTKSSTGYKRHIAAVAAAGSSLHDLRVGHERFTKGCCNALFHVCLSAAGLPEQSLLPLKLQLTQTGENGWVH